MRATCSSETGITSTVRTYFSKASILNLIEKISEKKVLAVQGWFDTHHIKPERCLIIGSYLTGLRLANYLSRFCQVTVLDIYPEMKHFLSPDILFLSSYESTLDGCYDTIIDTTGLGGIKPDALCRYHTPETFIVEDPCSDGSDPCITRTNRCMDLIRTIKSTNRGILYTSGLDAKTSGTMTLTLEVIRSSLNQAVLTEGVLYCSSHLDFFERILFKEKDVENFFKSLQHPCLVISSLRDPDPDLIIEQNIRRISSEILDYKEPDT